MKTKNYSNSNYFDKLFMQWVDGLMYNINTIY